MKNKYFGGQWLFPLIAAISLTSPAQAEILPHDPVLHDCRPTPDARGETYPGTANIVKSNKLARPAGKAEFPFGQIVYVSGQVMDESCTPISGAIVDIWQTDRNGKYRFASRGELSNPYPVFAGSGRSITDNMGRYSFITIFPGPYETWNPRPKPGHWELNAPHIHFRIAHEDFPSLITKMYFEGDARNDNDPSLRRLSEEIRSRLSAEVFPRSQAMKRKPKIRSGPLVANDDPRLAQMTARMRNKVIAQVSPMNPNDPNSGILATFNVSLRGKSGFKRF